MKHLLYVIGVPGSGKTTLMRQLVLGRKRIVVPRPFMHTVYMRDGAPELVQLGRDRAQFGGTDALSMSVQPKVHAALATGAWPRVVGEGDRLANARFFQAAVAAGYLVTAVLLVVPDEVAAERRAARGSEQDETWLRGRRTKVANLVEALAEMHGVGTLILDGTKPVGALAERLSQHPVIRREAAA